MYYEVTKFQFLEHIPQSKRLAFLVELADQLERIVFNHSENPGFSIALGANGSAKVAIWHPGKSEALRTILQSDTARSILRVTDPKNFDGNDPDEDEHIALEETEHAGKYSFAFTASTTEGKTVTDRIVADTVNIAWLKLEQQGYREIQLLDEENSAIRVDNETSSLRLNFTAGEEQALRRQKSVFATTVWLFCRFSNMLIWVPLLGWLAFSVAQDGWQSPYAALPAALLATFLLWFAWARMPGIMFSYALDASAWCRWSEVERWMRWLTRWKGWFNTPFPEDELLLRTATAEAGQGRLAAALRRVAPLATDANLASGLHQTRLARLYFAAKDFNRAAATQQEAHELNPTNSSAIDVATTLARRLGDTVAAENLLDSINVSKIPPMAKIFYLRCRGVIALDTEQPGAACAYLKDALFLARTHIGSPLLQSLVLDARAYYALALVATGEFEAATPHFAASRPMLEAQRDIDLLARCDAAQKMAK